MRFGLVGAGEIGRIRADALRHSRDCSLSAVADRDSARAGSAAGAHGAAALDDFRELIGRDDVDAVAVSTPPDSHEEITLAALEAGKHVLCEKPLAPNVAACRRMVEAARRRGLVLATGFCQRYFPAVRFIKQTAASGEIGELTHVRAYTGHLGLSEFREAWMYDKRSIRSQPPPCARHKCGRWCRGRARPPEQSGLTQLSARDVAHAFSVPCRHSWRHVPPSHETKASSASEM